MAKVIQLEINGDVKATYPFEDVKLATRQFYSFINRHMWRGVEEDGDFPKYKTKTIYKTFDGQDALIRVVDKEVDSSAKSADTEPWYVVYMISPTTGDKAIAKGHKRRTVIAKLNSLGIWIKDFELDKEYDSDSGLKFKVKFLDEAPKERMKAVNLFGDRKDQTKQRSEVQPAKVFVPRRKSVGADKKEAIPKILSNPIKRIESERPFFIHQNNVSGRTTIGKSEIVDKILRDRNIGRITYWITKDEVPFLFKDNDKWYSINASKISDPILQYFVSHLSAKPYSVD